MILVSYCSCLCPTHCSQVLSREWTCSWSSAHRVINNFITYWSVTYIRGFAVFWQDNNLITIKIPNNITASLILIIITQIPNSCYPGLKTSFKILLPTGDLTTQFKLPCPTCILPFSYIKPQNFYKVDLNSLQISDTYVDIDQGQH